MTKTSPIGTISLPTALERFRKHKWNGADPYDDLAWLRNMAVAKRPRWPLARDSPLWVASPVSPPQALARLSGLAPDVALEWETELHRRGLEARIENILDTEPLREADEFFGAFAAGTLVAVNHNGGYAEPERWQFFEVYHGSGYQEMVVRTPEGVLDWQQLFVGTQVFKGWLRQWKPGRPHHELTLNQRVVRATLQTLMMMGAISSEGTEAMALSWGFRRLRDTELTLAEDSGHTRRVSGPKTELELAQEKVCRLFLKRIMADSPSAKWTDKKRLWAEVMEAKFPALREHTWTHEIWPNVSDSFPAWRKPGAYIYDHVKTAHVKTLDPYERTKVTN